MFDRRRGGFNPNPPPFFTPTQTYHPSYLKRDPEVVWMKSPEANKLAAAAKAKALSDFKKRFPKADMTKFKTEVSFAGHKATADVLFIEGPDSWADISLIDRKDWTEPMKAALGLYHSGGFPYQLTLDLLPKKPPIPAIAFSESIPKQMMVGAALNDEEQKIYVSPT